MAEVQSKKLTVENWLEPDKASSLSILLSPEDETEDSITSDEWLRRILDIDLVEIVPAEVQRLFEVARGHLLMGISSIRYAH